MGPMRPRAFTLIEILLVAVIIAVIASLALLKIDGLIPSSRIKKQTRTLANVIELAIARAAVAGRDIALMVDRETRSIRLDYYDPEVEEEESSIELDIELPPPPEIDQEEDDAPLYEVPWETGVELESLEVDTLSLDDVREFVIFTPFGQCDGLKVKWRDDHGHSQSLELWSLSGRIVIHPLVSTE